MKELKNNVNTLLWLMVTLSVMMMFSLVCLSSCNSSVNPNGKGDEVTVRVASDLKNGRIDSIKVNSVDFSNKKEFTVKYNDVIEFKAVPDDGYKVVKWTPGILKISDDKLTAKMIVTKDMKDLTVSIKFEKGNNPPGPTEKETLTVDALRKELIVKDKDEEADKGSVVTSLYGLGLKKEDGQFKYQMLEGNNTIAKTGKEIIQFMKAENITVIEDKVPDLDTNLSDELKNYSLGKVLKAKWDFAKNSEKIVPKEFRTFTFNNAAGRNERPSVVGLYELLSSDYYISYKNGEVYLEVALPNTDYFADWTIAFVKKSESHEVYVFSVGEIEEKSETDMKIKPYILRNVRTGKVKNYKYLPDLEVLSAKKLVPDLETHHGMKLCHTYRFSLSSLLKDYLKQVSILENWDGKYKYSDPDKSDNKDKCISDLSEKFIAEMLNPTDYDIYMTIGAYRDPNGEIYTNRGSFRRGWRNAFKLTDSEFWDKCFKK